MEWFYLTIGGGLAALLCFILSLVFAHRKQCIIGLVLGMLEFVFAVISASNWAEALRVSGKIDWFLFGLLGYPSLGLICYSMFGAGVLCIALSVRGILKHKKGENRASEAQA